jgi:CHAT domain-containing protein
VLDVAALGDELGDRLLIELVRHGSDLHAVTVLNGRVAMSRLCSYVEATAETTALRFALTRLAHPTGSGRVRALAARGRAVAADHLDTLLLDPLRSLLGDRPLVVVPTGDLHALPWPVLPSLVGRATVVAPSARLWLRASRRTRHGAGVALVAGPRLDHAEAEIAALAQCYEDAVVLSGARATAEAVSVAIDGAALAHLATHGHFRSDNPQFSALELADGPLTVYDLERLSEPPDTVVLSACDSGLSEVKPGDELMGLAAAVMSLGTRTLVASAVPVADEPTRPFMQAFHRRLLAGTGAAEALAVTSAETGLDGFVCVGAG